MGAFRVADDLFWSGFVVRDEKMTFPNSNPSLWEDLSRFGRLSWVQARHDIRLQNKVAGQVGFYGWVQNSNAKANAGYRRMSATSLKILAIDDEAPIRRLLRMGTSTQGYKILDAPNGKIALGLLDKKPDLVTLDLDLPDFQGLELLKIMRVRIKGIPIIVLSSRVDEASKVQALDLGAYDYVTKPFGMNELLARMRAALRHQLQSQGERPLFRVGELSVDLVRRTVRVGERYVKLSPKEYDLLRVLVQHAGKVLPYRFLLAKLWSDLTEPQYLRVYVGQLRQKIEVDVKRPQYVLTEMGTGYRLRAPDCDKREIPISV